jgi:hypothetical protein
MKHAMIECGLDKPSLEALSYVLRNRDLWPADFVWDYKECSQCAMGLAIELWNLKWENTTRCELLRNTMNMKNEDAMAIFYLAAEKPERKNKYITPEMIADDIDQYLTKTSRD